MSAANYAPAAREPASPTGMGCGGAAPEKRGGMSAALVKEPA